MGSQQLIQSSAHEAWSPWAGLSPQLLTHGTIVCRFLSLCCRNVPHQNSILPTVNFFSDFIRTNLPSCAQPAGNSSPARPGTRPFRAARHRMWCQPVLKSHNAVARIGLIFGSASFLHSPRPRNVPSLGFQNFASAEYCAVYLPTR